MMNRYVLHRESLRFTSRFVTIQYGNQIKTHDEGIFITLHLLASHAEVEIIYTHVK